MNHFRQQTAVPILLVSVFIIAICGILYELLISSISAYLLGSSILHFSLTIGLFLSFMGFGAFLSRFVGDEHLLHRFISIELWLGLIGGASGGLLYLSYSTTESYYLVAFFLIATIGTLIGLEIPILTRIVKNYFDLKDTLAQVLSFDYLGALIASVVFPLFLLPYFGMMRTSFFIGLLNLSVGIFNVWIFRPQLVQFRQLLLLGVVALLLHGAGFYFSYGISGFLEQMLYQDEVVLLQQSSYQNLVVTRWKDDIRLYIDNNLQFSSVDEHRYHEALVHLPMMAAPRPERVLILGGGDGLAAREILKYQEVKQIDLVDLDPAMTDLARKHALFRKLNKGSMSNPRVRVHNQDAYKFIENGSDLYSVIIIDLPDPHDVSLGKLYSQEFYRLLQKRLTADGVVVSQSTSPFFARNVFWCINHTMESVFPVVLPYTLQVHSFGQWGFNMALNYRMSEQDSTNRAQLTDRLTRKLQANREAFQLLYLNTEVLPALFVFDNDVSEVPSEVNRLNTQQIIRYYESSWKQWQH